jgi:hypothetical protein
MKTIFFIFIFNIKIKINIERKNDKSFESPTIIILKNLAEYELHSSPFDFIVKHGLTQIRSFQSRIFK